MSLALADVYRVPGLARACTVHSCVTREGFRLRVNLQKTRVHGCVHAILAILNACTVLAIIKFKSSCTVGSFIYVLNKSIKDCLAFISFCNLTKDLLYHLFIFKYRRTILVKN